MKLQHPLEIVGSGRPAMPELFSLPNEWYVVGPVERGHVLLPDQLKSMPVAIETTGRSLPPRRVEADKGRLDMAPYIGGTADGRSAWVFVPFVLEHDATLFFGFGADWWFEAFLDGKPVLDTLKGGNVIHPASGTDHSVEQSLAKGSHVLAVRFISGSTSSMLCLGAAPCWELATADTRVSLVGLDDALWIRHLGNAAAGFNWVSRSSRVPFIGQMTGADGRVVPLQWRYQSTEVDETDGVRVSFRFVSRNPDLELVSQWWAPAGRGPVRHAMILRNESDQMVSMAVDAQPIFDLVAQAPRLEGGGLTWHYVNDEGALWGDSPDIAKASGYYQAHCVAGATHEIQATPGYDFIPIVICGAGEAHGLYVAVEWSSSVLRFGCPSSYGPLELHVAVANMPATQLLPIAPGGEFLVPPVLLGTYAGDLDDGGNSLRSYLFHHSMPEELRLDPTYPKLEWNSFTATGKTHNSQTEPTAWDPVEVKYYPFIEEAGQLGFEEISVDVAWWEGPEPVADPVDWPQGMKAAGDATHRLGMRYVLYWTDDADMASPEGRALRMKRIKRLFQEYGADTWRSDATRGYVIGPGYPAVKGFYEMLDALKRDIPGFQWENCSGGGPIKDYGALKRSTKIQPQDSISPAITQRRVFYDSSLVLHPIQLQGFVGWKARNRPGEPGGLLYDFRTAALGAFMWWFDGPAPTNGGIPWTAAERQAIAREVQTYKTRLRPLIREANLYHILPRPDDRNWDGIQYHDPAGGKGVAYIFKPASEQNSRRIRLKGLEREATYRLDFEDGSNPPVVLSGGVLMEAGFPMSLEGVFVSELVWVTRQ